MNFGFNSSVSVHVLTWSWSFSFPFLWDLVFSRYSFSLCMECIILCVCAISICSISTVLLSLPDARVFSYRRLMNRIRQSIQRWFSDDHFRWCYYTAHLITGQSMLGRMSVRNKASSLKVELKIHWLWHCLLQMISSCKYLMKRIWSL